MGHVVKSICKIKHWSGYELARRLGVTQVQAYRLLRSQSGLPRDPHTVYNLYRASGLTAKEFLELMAE